MGSRVNAIMIFSEGLIALTAMAGFSGQPAPITDAALDDFIDLPNGGGGAEPVLAHRRPDIGLLGCDQQRTAGLKHLTTGLVY